MKTTLKEITPQWARQVLETRNPLNRTIAEKFVKKMARDIQSGGYLLTHQAIAFDTNGDLIDGQHRLSAVVMANMPIKSLVVTDVPASSKLNGSQLHTFSVIDTGRARKVGQMLQMEGYKNANRIAAASRIAAQVCSTSPSVFTSISTPLAKLVLGAFGGSIEKITSLVVGGKIVNANTASVAAIAFWHTVNPHEAESFTVELVDVLGKVGAATRLLASWVGRHPQSGGVSAFYHFQATANAIEKQVKASPNTRIYCSDESVAWLLSINPKLKAKIAAMVPNYEK